MEKHILDRRLEQMAAEGVEFQTGRARWRITFPSKILRKEFDAILLSGGAEAPRDLKVPGRELKGIHFAMDFLPQQNKRIAGDDVPGQILATGKRVVIIGGGDTGADCLGTCHRQKAASVQPIRDHAHAAAGAPCRARRGRCGRCSCAPKARTKRVACAIGRSTRRNFSGDENGNVKELHGIRVGPPPKFEALPGTEIVIETDLVLLALGFTGPVKQGMLEQLGVKLDSRGNMATKGTTAVRFPESSPREICAAASLSWSGPLPKAAAPRPPSTITSPARNISLWSCGLLFPSARFPSVLSRIRHR